MPILDLPRVRVLYNRPGHKWRRDGRVSPHASSERPTGTCIEFKTGADSGGLHSLLEACYISNLTYNYIYNIGENNEIPSKINL